MHCFDRMQQWQHADVCSSGCEVFGVFCGLYEVHWVSLTCLKCICTKHCLDALSELIHQRTLLSCALRCETFFVVCTCAVVGRFDLYNMHNTLSVWMLRLHLSINALCCRVRWCVRRFSWSVHVQWLVYLTCTICTINKVHSYLDASSALKHQCTLLSCALGCEVFDASVNCWIERSSSHHKWKTAQQTGPLWIH